MWVYRHKSTGQLLATNPKVMTRTLQRQRSIERLASRKRYVYFGLKTFNHHLGPQSTLLARNPYSRVESFFKDKLRAVRSSTVQA